MTREEFIKLPLLLTAGQAAACGYSRRTLLKYANNEILRLVCPAGCVQRRFQKKQLAQLLGWEDALNLPAWRREPPLLTLNAVCQWTGYDSHQVSKITKAGGLSVVNAAGIGRNRYRKTEVQEWIGFQ